MHNSDLILSSLWTQVLEYVSCLESYCRRFRISKPQKLSSFKFNHSAAGKWHVIAFLLIPYAYDWIPNFNQNLVDVCQNFGCYMLV